MGRYTYLAARLADGQVLDELPATMFTFEETLNRPGGWSATLPLRHPRVTRSLLAEVTSTVWAVRDGQVLGGGICWSPQADTSQGTLTVGGEGLWALWRDGRATVTGRAGMTWAGGTGSEVRFNGVDQFDIVADLIGHAGAAGGRVDLPVVYHGPAPDGRSGVLRDRSYFTYEASAVGELVENLAEVIDGFDFTLDVTLVDSRVRPALHLWYPQVGRQTDVLFEQRRNVEVLNWAADGARYANVVRAMGAGEGDDMLLSTATATSQIAPTGPYPRVETAFSNKDVKLAATLDAQAAARLATSSIVPETLTVQVVDTVDSALGTYRCGDQVTVSCHDGYLEIEGRYQVQGVKVTIDEVGDETITVTLANRGG